MLQNLSSAAVVIDALKVKRSTLVRRFFYSFRTDILIGNTKHLFWLLKALCADPENFVRGFPTVTIFFSNEGREVPNTTLCGPSSARHLNGFAGVPMMAQH